MPNKQKFSSFAEFYPYYLTEHRQPACRAWHYVGNTAVIVLFVWILFNQQWPWLWALLLCGYGFAWIGHFFVERNRPATFQYPFYSLFADWVMYKDFLTGQLAAKLAALDISRR